MTNRPTTAAAGSTGPGRRKPGLRPAFTLLEVLVVIAITAILMFILFIPVTKSLELSARGNAKIEAQDNVRRSMERITRDISNAMEVYPQDVVNLYGFDTWRYVNNHPQPAPNAVSQAYPTPNALIAFRLPKMQYYCT